MRRRETITIKTDAAYERCKRLFDFSAATVGLLLLSPVIAVAALAIRLSSEGPLFYRGVRVGCAGRQFRMFKFRTMVVDAERLGGSATAQDDPRITPVGHWLRRYKLDELPQLFNVLRGEMSLVGPRPEVPKYVDMLSPDERIVLDAVPGITDWASIWNSNEAAVLEGSPDPEQSYEELIRPTKIALQILYVRHRSFALDIRILFHTVLKLVCGGWMPRELAPYGQIRSYKQTAIFTSANRAPAGELLGASASEATCNQRRR